MAGLNVLWVHSTYHIDVDDIFRPGRSRRAPAPHKAELGTSSDGLSFTAFGEGADHTGNEDILALRRALFVRP